MTDSKRTVDQPEQPGADAPESQPTPGATAPGGNGGPSAPAAEQAGGADVGDGVAEIQGDLDELVRTAAERDEYLALAQRTQADFENYRKRVAREAAGAQERGVAALAKELL